MKIPSAFGCGSRGGRRTLFLGMATLATLSCFSERTGVTPPEEDLCELPARAGVVQIRNFAFQPAELRIRPGDRVTWVNCDSEVHTSTSDGAGWDSGILSPRTSFSHTFPQAGRFGYHCEPHPFMTAVVVVE